MGHVVEVDLRRQLSQTPEEFAELNGVLPLKENRDLHLFILRHIKLSSSQGAASIFHIGRLLHHAVLCSSP